MPDILPLKNPHFIGSWDVDKNLCRDICNFFNFNDQFHAPGETSIGIDVSKKKSIDLEVHPKDINLSSHAAIKSYFSELLNCYSLYKKEWPFLEETFPKVDISSFNIQKYEEGGHFSKIHSERTSILNLHRLFAFMTYLNDDFEGGKTYFSHYDITITPKTGLTLIWPAEWTHAHRGGEVERGSKYIITGWINIHLPSIIPPI
jgi:hypothetical protein